MAAPDHAFARLRAAAKLAAAQLVLARAHAHDISDWPRFLRGVEMFNAICADEAEAVLALLRQHPSLPAFKKPDLLVFDKFSH